MTVALAVIVCIAGFLLSFLAMYTLRRRGRTARPTGAETGKEVKQVRCPWCGRKEYGDANPPFSCPECGAVHHRSCWEEYGGCAILDCPLAPMGEEAEKVA